MLSRKMIAGIVSVVLGTIIVLSVWQNSTFRLTGTWPSLSSVPSAIPYIDIHFNKDIRGRPSISANPDVIKNYTISGKTIRIKLKALIPGKDYTVSLGTVRSTNDKSLSKSLRFKARDIAFEKLPIDEKNAIINGQDPNDPSLVTNDPLVAHLPYGDLDYNISYFITKADNKPSLVIQVNVLLTGADYKQSPAAVQNVIKQKEQAALDYIKSLGLDPSKYRIQYSTPSG